MAEVINEAHCPRDTMVGPRPFCRQRRRAQSTFTAPVFNIAPAPGEPVAFGFNAALFPVRLDTSVLSDGNYGVRVTTAGLTRVQR